MAVLEVAATIMGSLLFRQCADSKQEVEHVDGRIGASFLNRLYVSPAGLPSSAAVDEPLPLRV